MKNRIARHISSKRSLLAAALLTLSLSTGTTRAMGVDIVHDPLSLAQAIEQWAKEAEQWAKQQAQWMKENAQWLQTIEHYREVVSHYAAQAAFWQEQLVKLKGLNFELFTLEHKFERVADDYGVRDACPGANQSLVGEITSALKTITLDMSKDVVQQQRDLCKLIVMTKNNKYNQTVDYLHAVAKASTDFTKIQDERLEKVGQSPANLESNSNAVARYQVALVNAREHWETNMKQCDAQIEMLTHKQANLSRRALHGNPSVLGTIINAATLKAALSQ